MMEEKRKRSYYSDATRNYLVLECPPDLKDNYQYRMLAANRIRGLLDCSGRTIDGREYLYYDITSRQSLADLFDRRPVRGTDLERILVGIFRVEERLTEYLLDTSHLVSDPDCIFMDFRGLECSFVYYPGDLQEQAQGKIQALEGADGSMTNAGAGAGTYTDTDADADTDTEERTCAGIGAGTGAGIDAGADPAQSTGPSLVQSEGWGPLFTFLADRVEGRDKQAAALIYRLCMMAERPGFRLTPDLLDDLGIHIGESREEHMQTFGEGRNAYDRESYPDRSRGIGGIGRIGIEGSGPNPGAGKADELIRHTGMGGADDFTRHPGAGRVKNNADALFFTPEVCAAGRPKPPVILHRFRLRENASGSRSASGMFENVDDFTRHPGAEKRDEFTWNPEGGWYSRENNRESYTESNRENSRSRSENGIDPMDTDYPACESGCGDRAGKSRSRVPAIMLFAAGALLFSLHFFVELPERETILSCAAGGALALCGIALFAVRLLAGRREKQSQESRQESGPAYRETYAWEVAEAPAVPTGPADIAPGSPMTFREPPSQGFRPSAASFHAETCLLGPDTGMPSALYGTGSCRGDQISLSSLPCVVGKLRDYVDQVVDDSTVSRMHARFALDHEGKMTVKDLNSTNGTWLNGERLAPNETRVIRQGDHLRLGRLEYVFR